MGGGVTLYFQPRVPDDAGSAMSCHGQTLGKAIVIANFEELKLHRSETLAKDGDCQRGRAGIRRWRS